VAFFSVVIGEVGENRLGVRAVRRIVIFERRRCQQRFLSKVQGWLSALWQVAEWIELELPSVTVDSEFLFKIGGAWGAFLADALSTMDLTRPWCWAAIAAR
jgi:hypothetical protein